MTEQAPTARPLLDGIRVLDLATQRAELAGRLLADLGAEVVKIEPPAGTPSRGLAPFDGGNGESLYWAAVGAGKHSLVLDIEAAGDRETLLGLVRYADVFIESFEPGYLDGLGLGERALRDLNPLLIYVSVTPFGTKGPKARWPATDLTAEAAGGRVGLQGDADRPPIPVGYPQAAFHAGARAAADAVIALNERDLSGLGQHLDTSMQEAVIYTLLASAGYPANQGTDAPGSGDDRGETQPAPRERGLFLGRAECADGYVVVTATSNYNLLRCIPETVLPVLEAAGQLEASARDTDWTGLAAAVRANEAQPQELQTAGQVVRAFFKHRTKAELMQWAWENDVHLGPCSTTRDLLTNPQLVGRGYWQKLAGRVHPGPSIRLTRSPVRFERAAPALGEGQARLQDWLRPRRLLAPEKPAPGPRLGEAFAGLKVADFSWVAVGPITAKALSDHGATVVRVESSTRIDYVRTLQPFKDNVPGINRSHWVNNLNTSKYGVALNLATPEGRGLARRLVDWADVVVENYTPGTMARLGLDFETVSRGHEDLIMISTCLMGQTGPMRSFAGYGPHGAAISGLYAITGWPDRAPTGPSGPYTDVIAPHYAISALAAAIFERRRSGLGQHIDVSQIESAIHFIEPLVLDETVNGRTATPAGHDSLYACPHGVFPTLGKQRYVAIAVETPAQWRALLALAPSLARFAEPRFDDLAVRMQHKGEIEAALVDWTRGFERRDLEERLVEAGVPASVVQRMTELAVDPQLESRGYWITLEQSEVGRMPYDGLMTRFSAKQTVLHKPAPSVGEDTDYVMREILGLTDDQIADYAAAGVFV
jgi:crotonobetainyl-CoA:carnitine CoA-transferase CaiB-like acyl-CoA transferase